MKEWDKLKIEELCSKITSGGTPLRKRTEYFTGSIPWIKTGELKGWYIYETDEMITDEAIENSSAKIYPEDTILMAMYGDGRTIGSVGITGVEAASNQACCAMIPNKKKCDPYFLLFALQNYSKELVNLALGGAQRNLNQKTIREFEINVPNIETQKIIGEQLSYFNKLIENNTRRITILEEMARLIYREWFVHYRYPGHEEDRMVDSGTELGDVPEGWEVGKIIDLYDTSAGGTPSRKKDEYYYNGHIPWLKTRELNDSFVQENEEYITDLGLKNSSAKLFPKYSVLVAMYGATVGKMGILDMDAATNQACCAIMEKEEPFDYSFLFFTLLENRKKLVGLSQGAAQQNINQGHIKDFQILKPDGSVLLKFQNKVLPMLNQIRTLKKQSENLKRTRDLLLPKLISGKIYLKELSLRDRNAE